MGETRGVREAAVAGFFYPRNAPELARDIDGMIDNARPSPVRPGHRVRVLVSPHAGYRYSGQVAASGYRLIKGMDFHTAVIVSPSHIEHFGYSAVYEGDGYETPLGVVPVSRAYSARLAGVNDRVLPSAHGHVQDRLPRREHALEVQIPFLQRALDSFELVAVVMGDQSWENCVALGDALAPLAADPGVLIVASTDLSHFYDAGKAKRLDGVFRDVLSTLDARAVYDRVETGAAEACGAGPVVAALLALGGRPGLACDVLEMKNSGDVSGDYSSVVGYLSAAITAPAED